MLIYLLSLPIWNFILPAYAYWHFDDFSWGDTRKSEGEKKGADKGGHGGDGQFDSSKITMKRWGDFEQERRLRGTQWGNSTARDSRSGSPSFMASYGGYYGGHERKGSSGGNMMML